MERYFNKLVLIDLFRSLSFNKFRTFLAVLGISMGISSVVLIVSAVRGSSLRANKIISKLGSDFVLVVSGSIKHGPRMGISNLSLSDARDISKLGGIFDLTYGTIKKVQVANLKTSKMTIAFGVGRNWLSSWTYKIDEGRGFIESDFLNLSKVAVVGHTVSDFLFPNESPIGKTIFIGKSAFKVVGVYQRRGKTPNGHNLDDRIFIPYPVFDKVVEPTLGKISVIRFRVISQNHYVQKVSDVKKLLLRRHSSDDFTVITPIMVRKFLSMMNTSLAAFLSLASITALIVGGFVLSSIFYINVYTRKWEIGLRRALGAARHDVLSMIIMESLIISLLGAIIGTFMGFGFARVILPMLGIPTVYPKESFLISGIFSIAVGVIAAYSPAKKAAMLEPVRSLRSKA